MAKPRQARFTTADLEGLPELDDESPALWPDGLPEVGPPPAHLGRPVLRVERVPRDHDPGHLRRDRPEPGALYVYFPSKELVLFEIIRAGHQRALEVVTAPEVDQAPDVSAHLHTPHRRYTEFHARHHVAARVCQYELAGLTAEHYEEILEIRHRTNAVFRDALAHGVDDGTFADVDVRRVSRAMLSLGIDLVRWYRRDGSDSPEQLGQLNADLALRMVVRHPS